MWCDSMVSLLCAQLRMLESEPWGDLSPNYNESFILWTAFLHEINSNSKNNYYSKRILFEDGLVNLMVYMWLHSYIP